MQPTRSSLEGADVAGGQQAPYTAWSRENLVGSCDVALRREIALPMTLELGVVPVVENPHFLYQVRLRGGRRVYMRAIRTNYMNERRVVVIVDATRFEKLWRGEGHPSSARADEVKTPGPLRRLAQQVSELFRSREQEQLEEGHRAWLAKKQADAAKGFEQGIYNPVPLAEVSCFRDTDGHWRATFTNGITRTEYLLERGAASFPVLCDSNESAASLHALAGVVDCAPKTVDALAPAEVCNLDYVIKHGFFDPKTHELDRFRIVRERWGREPWWEQDLAESRALCPYH